jgi:hypothetical protein
MDKEEKLFELLEMLKNIQILLHDVVEKLQNVLK